MHQLRTHAISHTFFPPTTLQDAINRLGFVQADPIRAPAPAQDLILRHRVQDYRVGDLVRHYPLLNLEEDFLYVYGFLPRHLWHLRRRAYDLTQLSELEQKVLDTVRSSGPMHPKELEAHFGRERATNGWGGYSKATTLALERLHRHGLLRISGRKNNIRMYEPAESFSDSQLPPLERFRQLIMVVANLMAPVSKKTLQFLISFVRYRSFPEIPSHAAVLRDLIREGAFEQSTVDGICYLWPVPGQVYEEQPRQVRFLAPFDPLVWDRSRFAHFWQWDYRFEAYVPPAKRVRGYYALPLLWGESVLGWVNASVTEGTLNLDLGFVEKQPIDREFRTELDAEIARFEVFLSLNQDPQESPG